MAKTLPFFLIVILLLLVPATATGEPAAESNEEFEIADFLDWLLPTELTATADWSDSSITIAGDFYEHQASAYEARLYSPYYDFFYRWTDRESKGISHSMSVLRGDLYVPLLADWDLANWIFAGDPTPPPVPEELQKTHTTRSHVSLWVFGLTFEAAWTVSPDILTYDSRQAVLGMGVSFTNYLHAYANAVFALGLDKVTFEPEDAFAALVYMIACPAIAMVTSLVADASIGIGLADTSRNANYPGVGHTDTDWEQPLLVIATGRNLWLEASVLAGRFFTRFTSDLNDNHKFHAKYAITLISLLDSPVRGCLTVGYTYQEETLFDGQTFQRDLEFGIDLTVSW